MKERDKRNLMLASVTTVIPFLIKHIITFSHNNFWAR